MHYGVTLQQYYAQMAPEQQSRKRNQSETNSAANGYIGHFDDTTAVNRGNLGVTNS